MNSPSLIRHVPPARSRSRGVAFLLVLWVVAMLSVLLGSFALIARTELTQSRHLFDTTRARYAAEAGLDLAVYELRKNDPMMRWVGDGRPYSFGFGDADVEVKITDDSGKIDLNAPNEQMLTNLFTARGLDPDRAQGLAAAIKDWIDPDDDTTLNGAELAQYKSAGLSYGPRNAPFDTVLELQQVLGMNYELFSKIEPALTIYSGQGMPNLANAPSEVLDAQEGGSADCTAQILEWRRSFQPGDPAAPPQPECATQAGMSIPMAAGGGLTYSVKSRAKLPNGASTTLDATIRMGGINAAGRPYVILRWRDGENS
jgi:general secretion pathway protein K